MDNQNRDREIRHRDHYDDYGVSDRRDRIRRDEDNDRTLTDADIDAIIDRFESKFTTFIGKSVWAAIQKVFITAVLGLLVYAYAFKGGGK